MKKLLLVLGSVVGLASAASAQTQQGYYLIGGNIGNIGGTFQKGSSSFNLGITPKVAWFVRDNIAIGGQVELGLNTVKDAGTNFSYNIGPIARYYVPGQAVEEVNKTRFFAEANVGFGGENNSKSGASTNGVVFGAGPGLAYFLNENIALEGLLKLNVKSGFGSSGVAVNPNLSVGFQIHLPSSKVRSLRNDVK